MPPTHAIQSLMLLAALPTPRALPTLSDLRLKGTLDHMSPRTRLAPAICILSNARVGNAIPSSLLTAWPVHECSCHTTESVV